MLPVSARGALDGLRVIDVTQVMAGPFCAMVLADLGADVKTSRRPATRLARCRRRRHRQPSFSAVNRGKRSIVINSRRPQVSRVKRLARTADILSRTTGRASWRRWTGTRDTRCAQSTADLRLHFRLRTVRSDEAQGGFDLVAQGVSHHVGDGEPGGAPGSQAFR